MAIGGPIESVSLKGRSFPVAADADTTRDLGGFTNELEPNGDGSARLIKKRKPWSVGGLALQIDDDRDDQEFLQGLQNSKDFFPVAVVYPSGATYQGVGQITGDLQTSNQNATGTITLSGPRTLTKQL